MQRSPSVVRNVGESIPCKPMFSGNPANLSTSRWMWNVRTGSENSVYHTFCKWTPVTVVGCLQKPSLTFSHYQRTAWDNHSFSIPSLLESERWRTSGSYNHGCGRGLHSGTSPTFLVRPDSWWRPGGPPCPAMWPIPVAQFVPMDLGHDVYARVCSCRQCWTSKCRGL
jgi:hypothetical protein